MNTKAHLTVARTADRLAPRLCLAFGVLALGAGIAALRPASAQEEAATVELAATDKLAEIVGPIALYPDALLAQVLMASTTRQPCGQRRYHPIYEAAAAYGLPVALHPGAEGTGAAAPPTPVGYPSRYLEWHTLLPLTAMARSLPPSINGFITIEKSHMKSMVPDMMSASASGVAL